jgi:outer membrane immunogenic protein
MKKMPGGVIALALFGCLVWASVPALADGARDPGRYGSPSFWQGLYAGAHVGYGDAGGGLDGAVVGGQIGYNWQKGLMVYGWEVDATWSDMSVGFRDPWSGASAELSVDWMATVRGRWGYLVQPNLLAYGTAGLGHLSASASASIPGVGEGSVSGSNTELVVGVGLEMKWNETTSVGVEYINFTDSDIDVVRARVNFKLPGY